MSKTLIGVIAILMTAGLVPFGFIALARSRPTTSPPVHPIQDMYHQPKFRAQRENAMFADGRAMRPLIPGVVARDDLSIPNEMLNDPNHPHMIDNRFEPTRPATEAEYVRFVEGVEKPAEGAPAGAKPEFVAIMPVKVTPDLMKRGKERFNIYCAACHGLSGYGDGTVARRALEMKAAGSDAANGWNQPTNYHADELRKKPVGYFYHVITNGIRTMPSYAKQISIQDRWAIVAYVKALQRSQDAKPEDIPENEQAKFPQ